MQLYILILSLDFFGKSHFTWSMKTSNVSDEPEISDTQTFTTLDASSLLLNSTAAATQWYENYLEVLPELWEEILNKSQLIMVLFGLIINIGTVVTLTKHGSSFSKAILILLRHQAVADGIACTIAATVLIQPQMWLTGNPTFDDIICSIWHTQAVYWTTVFASVWNLVALAFERYLAVCHPFKLQDLTTKRLNVAILMIWLLGFFATWPAYTYLFHKDGTCAYWRLKEVMGTSLYSRYPISTFFTIYCIPCGIFVILYGCVILAFYKRKNQSELASSIVIDRASRELTKTAIIITVIFIVCIGFGMWYFLLGLMKVVPYRHNNSIQKTGVWLSSVNSSANPLVYTLVMPAFRKSVLNTFFRRCIKQPGHASSSSSVNTLSTAADTYKGT